MKKLLSKFWDKALLAVALISLIVVSVLLMGRIDSLQQQLDSGPHQRRPPSNEIETIDQVPYTQTLTQLKEPFIWQEMPNDPFRRPQTRQLKTPVEAIPMIPDTEEAQGLALLNVEWKPFKLVLKAYNWDETSQTARNFQINVQFRSRTYFVSNVGDEIADRFERTGFRTIKFERKIKKVFKPSLNTEVDRDHSELTIQYQNEEPIVLITGQVVREREPVATMQCDPGYPAQPRKLQLRRGQEFDCAGTKHIVVDIKPRQMLIKDVESQETITLELAGAQTPTIR